MQQQVSAEKGKGGTWSGATEELKRPEARPVFVRLEGDVPGGNRALLEFGARSFPTQPWETRIRELLQARPQPKAKRLPSQAPLFGEAPTGPVPEAMVIKETRAKFTDAHDGKAQPRFAAGDLPQTAYEAVLPLLLDSLVDWQSPVSLSDSLELRKLQLDDWLKRALAEGRVLKKDRPVRYRRK